MGVFEKILNVLPDFVVFSKIKWHIDDEAEFLIDSVEAPLVLKVYDVELAEGKKLVDVRKFGKNPVILVKDGKENNIAVIDDDYRFWIVSTGGLTVRDVGNIVKAFFKAMSDENFVREVIKAKLKLYNAEVSNRRLNNAVKKITGMYSNAVESVEEIVDEFVKTFEELKVTVDSLYDTAMQDDGNVSEDDDDRIVTIEELWGDE